MSGLRSLPALQLNMGAQKVWRVVTPVDTRTQALEGTCKGSATTTGLLALVEESQQLPVR
jgi:hypothetical protein